MTPGALHPGHGPCYVLAVPPVEPRAPLRVRSGLSFATDPRAAVAELARQIEQPDPSVVLFFCSPSYDLDELGPLLKAAFPCPVIGCTSAGQIGPAGFQRGGITASSLASSELWVRPFLISPLSDHGRIALEVAATVRLLRRAAPASFRSFGLLLVDGLAQVEERLAAALYQSLGDMPLVGGSAGDDLRFERTHVYHDGKFLPNAALFTLFETSHPFTTFKLQHVEPTDTMLVTTAADPARRIVHEINGMPAAEAYAEAVGLPIDQLDSYVFSKHPVLLKLGADYYIRAIQRVHDEGSITFMCAIDEGLVLRVGASVEPRRTLENGFRAASMLVGKPSVVIGCDCILRRLELEKDAESEWVGAFFAHHNVIGFSTYGEQYNAVHVNQTFAGIALGD